MVSSSTEDRAGFSSRPSTESLRSSRHSLPLPTDVRTMIGVSAKSLAALIRRTSDPAGDGDVPPQRVEPADIPKPAAKPTPRGELARRVLSCPGMWGLCSQSFFRAAGYAFFVTWFFAFLEYGEHVTHGKTVARTTVQHHNLVLTNLRYAADN